MPCESGRVYVGETGRTLKQRITEHKQAVRNVDSNNGLTVYVARTKHKKLRWDEAEVVCIGKNCGRNGRFKNFDNQGTRKQSQLRCWSIH